MVVGAGRGAVGFESTYHSCHSPRSAVYLYPAAEFVPISERSFSGSMMMLLWLIGPFLVAALSYVLTDWRYIQIISCAPLALCLGYWW